LVEIDDEALDDEPWVQKYVDAIDTVAPDCGLQEYLDAMQVRHEDMDKAVRLVRRAKRKAEKASETGVVEYLSMIEGLVSGSPLGMLEALFDGMDADDVESFLDSLDEERMPDIFDDLFR
jgi:hypothetical protein